MRELGLSVKNMLQSCPSQDHGSQHNYFLNPFHWIKAVSGILLDIIWKPSVKSLFCNRSFTKLALNKYVSSYSMSQFNSLQSLSCVWLFVTPWTVTCQASLSITNSRSLLKLMSVESVMPSNDLILCCPLLLLPSIFPRTRVFPNESVLRIRWPKCWSFSLSISPSNEHSGMISFRMDWLDLLAVQGTLKSLLQHHSSKTSILQHSAFFIVQLSHPYMTTGKTIALTRWTFVGKVMSLATQKTVTPGGLGAGLYHVYNVPQTMDNCSLYHQLETLGRRVDEEEDKEIRIHRALWHSWIVHYRLNLGILNLSDRFLLFCSTAY